jgi:uncharacterized membrane protein YeaQ/YmgE (transglycosylase-associated protein family)
VALADAQEAAEAHKRTQAEERDRRTGQVLTYVIGVLLLVLTNTLRNVLEATTSGLPPAVATYLQAVVSALIVLAIIVLAARGRSGTAPPAAGGGGH